MDFFWGDDEMTEGGVGWLLGLGLSNPPKFNSSPLKSDRNPIGKDRLSTTIFQRPCSTSGV